MCFANKEKIFCRMSRVKSKAQIEICGDCGASDPSWASINRGIFLCSECCSIHRSLGRHISQVKSLRQGTWSPSVLNFVSSLNAHGANSVWEHCLLDSTSNNSGSKQLRKKPNPKDPLHPVKLEFIKAKHVNLAYVLKPNNIQAAATDDDSNNIEIELSKQLHASVRTSNLETSLRLIVQGADPNFFHEEKRSTPLHVAAKFGQASQIELLIVYGAEINVVDGNGLTPIEIAKNNKHNIIAERLIEAMYEVTDRITLFLGGKKPNHSTGKHLIIPEQNMSEISEQLKIARGKLQLVPNKMFEELVMDLYDEVDRRENEAIWATSSLNPEIGAVPFLPANPYLSATRNQGRQKLARFSPIEFAGLLTDVLIDAKRRQNMANLRPTINSSAAGYSTMQQQHQQQIRESNLSDDEPLYDAVASDDDYATLTPIFAQKDIINQLASTSNNNNSNSQSSNEVESLRRQLMEYMSEISQLKNVVQKLSTENSELKSKIIDTTSSGSGAGGSGGGGIGGGIVGIGGSVGNNNTTTTTTIITTTTTTAISSPSSSSSKNNYMYDVPLRIDLNGTETETEIEPLIDSNNSNNNDCIAIDQINSNNINQQSTIKRPVSMYETRLGPYTKAPEYRTTTSMYQMASSLSQQQQKHQQQQQQHQQQQQQHQHKQQQQSPLIIDKQQTITAVVDYFQPFGEEVKHRTNLVTKRLKELYTAMQDKSNKEAFVPCAEKICVAVNELTTIFTTQNCCNESIKCAIKQLNIHTGLIQCKCENLQKSLLSDNVTSIDICMQEVRDCAFQLASATKNLVMQFQ